MTDPTHGLTDAELAAADICRMTPAEYAAYKNPRVDPAEFAERQERAKRQDEVKEAVREVLAERGSAA